MHLGAAVGYNNERPAGPPISVFHSHLTRRSISNVASVGRVGLSVARDKIVFTMGEIAGNIWMVETAAEP